MPEGGISKGREVRRKKKKKQGKAAKRRKKLNSIRPAINIPSLSIESGTAFK
jgi:hypothetical protein